MAQLICGECWMDAFEPCPTEAECSLAHPHSHEPEHVRCGYCRLTWDVVKLGAEARRLLVENARLRQMLIGLGESIDTPA